MKRLNALHHFGQLIKNIKPMNENSNQAAPVKTMRAQTRMVPLVAINWTSLLLVSGSSPATLCYAPGCLASSGGQEHQCRDQ